jgi:hypothetical protein
MKYKVDYNIDDLVRVYSRRWAFVWLEKYHPEVIERAEQELKKLADAHDGDPEKFCNAVNSDTDE